ncbi:DUF1049 domain-containing protein [Altererythrobacter aerius]|uniref:DUF1049 domain-containing protein n=1 Tax=Tsuneonella aeria TaxID=1837929 RepID=A0A6I4TB32_9SPHN|nr:LapA family protein [Tsuneonella aeria]MXO73887.1 DUF1049 domain-containing protein [Tsuneonella aeria]
MQALRLIGWVAVTAVFVMFMSINYTRPVPVRFWPMPGDTLLVEWPVAVIALVFFLLGFVPTWLMHRAVGWRLKRRITLLETTARNHAMAAATPPIPPATVPGDSTPAHPPYPRADDHQPVAGAPVPKDDILK